MKRSTMITTMAVAVLTLTSSMALAQGRWGGGQGRGMGKGPGPRGMMGQRFAQMLELTDSQRQQVRALREQMRESTAETRTALQTKHSELHALWLQEVPNRAEILAKHAEMEPLKATMREAKIDLRLAVHSLLTPEQRAKLAQLPPPGRRGKHGRGFGGPGGGFGGGHGPGPWADGGEDF